MELVKIIEDFDIKVNQENVFKMMDCRPDSDIYEEMVAVFGELEKLLRELAEPKAMIQYVSSDKSLAVYGLEKEELLYVIVTLGKKIEEKSSAFFAEGEYVSGMMLDTMADDYLFQMEDHIQDSLKSVCAQLHRGIAKRMEAGIEIPVQIHKNVWERAGIEKRWGVALSSGYMFDPVKTSCLLLLLTDDQTVFKAQHDCSACAMTDCKLRKHSAVSISLSDDPGRELPVKAGESILDVLKKHDVYIPAFCAGRGTCGKCRIRVEEGRLEPSEADYKTFTPQELEAGLRLACKAYPSSDLVISLAVDQEDSFEILSSDIGGPVISDNRADEPLGIAIDIGTTTIAMELIGLESGQNYGVYSHINRQRAYGADVISRIEASNSGEKDVLRQCIIDDIKEGVSAFIQKGAPAGSITRMVISANTTMIHLLMGYDCHTLGVYPFTPVNIKTIRAAYEKIFEDSQITAEVIILPGISTYVGADITSGLLCCDFLSHETPALLIDLGTNGEMAIGSRDKILTTSTAAGPAFEGGNISCGTGSIKGAIRSVRISDGGIIYETIADAPPVGICGTGVIDITSELVANEIVDETGLIDNDDYEDGIYLADTPQGQPIIFTQKDIREIQLAKAAVRAGIEVLTENYGTTYDKIDTVYLSGGFGFRLDITKAVTIGLIPSALQSKVKVAGNSSLKGAIQCLLDPQALKSAEKIAESAEEISLANDKSFNEYYMEAMYFEQD